MRPRYDLRFSRSARRALTDDLPEKIAAAAFAFITGALRENPQRVGKQLQPPLFRLYSARRGDYRVIYRILDGVVVIEIVSMVHPRDAYRA
jgi:mRNA interferase RelE/StbE